MMGFWDGSGISWISVRIGTAWRIRLNDPHATGNYSERSLTAFISL